MRDLIEMIVELTVITAFLLTIAVWAVGVG